jgi:hypothetical protein
MAPRHEIRSFDYVNHPYPLVRAALVGDTASIIRAATGAATSRAEAIAAELHMDIGGLRVATEVRITLGEIVEDRGGVHSTPTTRIPVSWEAVQHPGMFPVMSAELSAYPLTTTETQLDFLGRYEPPLGVVGGAIDALVMHRIADACVHRFVTDIAAYLRSHLATD